MQVKILGAFLLVSASLLFSTVVCDPNHHHNNHNDFPWEIILSSLGIVVENQTSVVSNTEPSVDVTLGGKEHVTSESSVEILKSETTDGIETPVVQNGTRINVRSSSSEGLGTGYKVGIPIISILVFIGFWYLICKCCCGCCQKETQGVVIMQPNTMQNQPPAPQIILQQPIIHQQAPPMYDAQQRWAQPPPQGPSQWNQPPQGPPQWAPHPMGQQQQYSPHGAYENSGFNQEMSPPPYNPGKY